MRVALIGNQDNVGYRIGKWMRSFGIDADLFIFEDYEVTERSQPESFDRHLANDGHPSWIRRYEGFGYVRPKWLFREQPCVRTIENEYDVALTAGYAGLLAGRWIRRIPFMHISGGSEVATLPHVLFRRDVPLRGLYGRVASWAARDSLSKAYAVMESIVNGIESLRSLGLGNKARLLGFPEDVRGKAECVDGALLRQLNDKYGKYARVCVWLSRLNYKDVTLNEYKGPEIFLEAFRRIVARHGGNVHAIVGAHGHNVEQFQQLVRDLGLEAHVDYVPHMPYWKLATHLSIENAIVCDTICPGQIGGLAGLAREALSVGAVVVRSSETSLIEACYGGTSPIHNVTDAESCEKKLAELIALPEEEFSALKGRSRQWTENHLDVSALVPKWIELVREAYFFHQLGRRRVAA